MLYMCFIDKKNEREISSLPVAGPHNNASPRSLSAMTRILIYDCRRILAAVWAFRRLFLKKRTAANDFADKISNLNDLVDPFASHRVSNVCVCV